MAQASYKGFSPILDRVLIRRVDDTPKDGVQIPSKYRQQTNKGEILALGWDKELTRLRLGQHVLFGEYSAEKFSLDGEDLYLIRLANIRGVQNAS